MGDLIPLMNSIDAGVVLNILDLWHWSQCQWMQFSFTHHPCICLKPYIAHSPNY
jgi:hypothetical protein